MIATMVLPDPTSPSNNLFIGMFFLRSFIMFHAAFFWASVKSKFKDLTNFLVFFSLKIILGALFCFLFSLIIWFLRWIKRNSSNFNLFLAFWRRILFLGKWTSFKAESKSIKLYLFLIILGSQSLRVFIAKRA